ncbi:hypothetical protein KVT40_001207 [Elsinoe batatas]|uniref:Uncharacterized protein n=1 Tax=Elsinoe batatas TaxID=2601811 RepID=A0A8K0LAS6_9PEZI|nr:hypothetical protein KVT40_001207 [Elsinoe batatas]
MAVDTKNRVPSHAAWETPDDQIGGLAFDDKHTHKPSSSFSIQLLHAHSLGRCTCWTLGKKTGRGAFRVQAPAANCISLTRPAQVPHTPLMIRSETVLAALFSCTSTTLDFLSTIDSLPIQRLFGGIGVIDEQRYTDRWRMLNTTSGQDRYVQISVSRLMGIMTRPVHVLLPRHQQHGDLDLKIVRPRLHRCDWPRIPLLQQREASAVYRNRLKICAWLTAILLMAESGCETSSACDDGMDSCTRMVVQS